MRNLTAKSTKRKLRFNDFKQFEVFIEKRIHSLFHIFIFFSSTLFLFFVSVIYLFIGLYTDIPINIPPCITKSKLVTVRLLKEK